ncbi:fumarylacetoacetate hydrolase family protein [Rhodoluna limnophila]|uniref:fumarylacetoacetate hydrolase family protein n=1 Tax=Rhodoluna limnophila TaxID=232537 RepID=UPI0011075141|nr:fumarylacetoacetate hydrolase family protein [Rhodoluna limnophila]
MRVARFSLNGEPKFGVLDGPELVVLAGHPLVNGYETTGERVPLQEVKLLAPIIPSKVVCIGKNYADHAGELGLALNPEPTIFFKPSSAIVGPGDPIQIPQQSERIELEVELTVVIGQIAKNVSEANALDYVWGFTIANDVTARDLQFSDDQWARSKAFDSFCPLGPWIETEFVPDGQILESRIDGETKQQASIDLMIHDVPKIISYVSQNMTLLPGDIILTGTPAGIAQIQRGEIIECEIEGIGTLLNPVV